MERADREHAGCDSNIPGNARRSWLRCQRAWIKAGCPRDYVYRNGKIEVLSKQEADLCHRKQKLDERSAKRRLAKK
jgi:hypothetical protein